MQDIQLKISRDGLVPPVPSLPLLGFLKLIIFVTFQEFYRKTQEEDSSTMHALRVHIVEHVHCVKYRQWSHKLTLL